MYMKLTYLVKRSPIVFYRLKAIVDVFMSRSDKSVMS